MFDGWIRGWSTIKSRVLTRVTNYQLFVKSLQITSIENPLHKQIEKNLYVLQKHVRQKLQAMEEVDWYHLNIECLVTEAL